MSKQFKAWDIKETAISLFKSRGYYSTTPEDIAKTSNILLKDITIYFQSKDELLEALWSERLINEFRITKSKVSMADFPLR